MITGIRGLTLIAVAIAGLVLTVATVAASPMPPAAGQVMTASTTEAASGPTLWSIAGSIDSVSGDIWMIGGFAVHVTGATIVEGGLPTVGTRASAEGTVRSDGTWLASRVHVEGTLPTPSPAVTTTLPAGKFEIEGTVESINGNTWVVGGITITVSPSTTIRGGSAAVGSHVEIKGTVLPDGTVVVQKAKVEDKDDDDAAESQGHEGDARRIAGLASRFGVSTAQIEQLRDSHLGWGEVFKVLQLAERSGQPITQVVSLHEDVHGWGKIEKQLGLKPGEKHDSLGQVTAGKAPTTTVAAPTSISPERQSSANGKGVKQGKAEKKDKHDNRGKGDRQDHDD